MYRTGSRHQLADALSRLAMDDIDNTPLGDEHLVLVIVSGDNLYNTNTIIFALEEHKSLPAHSVLDADRSGATQTTLVES